MSENTYIWTDQTGIEWDVRDMTDRHLSNAIRFIERRLAEVQRKRGVVSAVMKGQTALEQVETDMNTLEGMFEHTLVIMRAEWSRRHQASKE